MRHIRVITPADVTSGLVGSLDADPGVENLVVMHGAAHPAGDAVQFDVTDGSANAVLQRLHDLGLDRDGLVAVEDVDVTIGTSRHQTYHGERAPVWAFIEARITANAQYSPSFFLLLAFAGLIGACGILINSQILIVGAMVVGPEYSAIIAVALGLDRRDGKAVRSGLLVLVAGFLFAIAVTLLFALCVRWAGGAPELFLHGVRPVSDLINTPNGYSVVVAVVAGLVLRSSLSG